MSGLQYANIPHCAIQMQREDVRVKPKLFTSIPTPSVPGESSSSPSTVQSPSPTRQTFSIPNLLLSSTLQLPNPPPISPRVGVLLSTRETLSLQATTVNFRRFVSKSGPIFWLQDRLEEVVMWRNGWKVTCTWMAIYTFLCFFPRMLFLLPHIIFISVLLATRGSEHQVHDTNPIKTIPASAQQPKEGTVDWYANLQAIQNLMGAVSDLYDAILPFTPILTWATPHAPQLLTLSCVSLLSLVPIAIFIPLRSTLLFVGLTPFIITHPLSLRILPTLLRPITRTLQSRAQRLIDNDNLAKQHWYSDKREIELWENERWSLNNGWSKSTLKTGERKPWTRGCDGWGDIVLDESGDNSTSGLAFVLSPGYQFIETEDWRLDREGKWAQAGVDDYGWVYMNDAWQCPNSAPLEEWKAQGMTRKRRWIRRIYLATML